MRQALDQALKRASRQTGARLSTAALDDAPETRYDASLHEELRAQATEETAALFLHELRPLVGLLDAAAADDIDGYSGSRTKASVDRVRSFLDAIAALRTASAAPAIQEFDLTDLVVRVVQDEVTRGRVRLDEPAGSTEEGEGLGDDAESAPVGSVVKVALARRDSMVTVGDPALVEIALANALRNAVEAVLALPATKQGNIVLNWGATDSDSWIVVLDEGCGLPAGWDRLVEPGVTTKSKASGHFGMGLPIARQAIESMHGSLRLTPRSGAGVACEIRWPHGDPES